MSGARFGRGCEGCRKRKKKCDLAQPSCSRCLRYGIRCVGSGERVFRFKNAIVPQSTLAKQLLGQVTPQGPLVNEATSTAGSFISVLEIADRKFAVNAFGVFLPDVPRRLAASPILDAAAKAFASSVTAAHSRQSTPQALKDYGAALVCMRNKLVANVKYVSEPETLCAVYLLLLSQSFTRGHNGDCLTHMQGLMHILNHQSFQHRDDVFTSQMIDLVSILVITESIVDSRVGSRAWHAGVNKTDYFGPLNDYSVVDIRYTNLTVANLTELSALLQEPEKHLLRLRSSYDMMLLESRKLVRATVQLNAACQAGSNVAYSQGYVICEASVCVLHSLMAILRRTLQVFHPEDGNLHMHSEDAAQQIIDSAARASSFRPLGTTYLPRTLCLMWATTDDCYMKARLEDTIDDYRDEFRGDSWTQLAFMFEQRFADLRRRFQADASFCFRQDTISPGNSAQAHNAPVAQGLIPK